MTSWKKDAEFQAKKAEVRRRGVDALMQAALEATDLLARPESAIEELMLSALCLMEVPLATSTPHPLISPCLSLADQSIQPFDRDIYPNLDEYALLFQQAKIAKYRVDFLIIAKLPLSGFVRVVVECDGHDYHDGSKEKAEKDKSRDRALHIEGCHVLRFSGREIWRDAMACAHEVGRLLSRIEFSSIRIHPE